MSEKFNWQTEDDSTWEEPSAEQLAPETSAPFPWLKRHSLWLATAAILLIIAATITYSLLNRQVKQAEKSTTADILAAHHLVHQAAQEKDFDLLAELLLNKDSDWGRLQFELLNIDLFLNRRPINMKVLLDSTVTQEFTPTVTLSPDLQTAELIERLPYQITSGQHLSETIWLEQTFQYQKRGDNWLLTSLPDEQAYWGNWQTFDEGSHLTLIYSEREAAQAEYLYQRLDDLLNRICEDDHIDCPSPFNIQIRLDRKPSSLQIFNEPIFDQFLSTNLINFNATLSLPAPTLVGLPIDEAGNESLYQGYANWLGTIMITRYSNDNPATYNLFTVLGLERPPDPIIALPLTPSIPTPPIPFPEQDILLACSDFSNITLFRYNPRINSWRDELSGTDTTYLSTSIGQFSGLFMAPLQDDSGLLLSLNHLDSEENRIKLVLWQDGQERLLIESPSAVQLLPEAFQRQFDPSGQYIVVYDETIRQSENELGIRPYALNLQSCLSGNCEFQDFNGFPYWSPDLTKRLLFVPGSEPLLFLENDLTGEKIQLGFGFPPLWIDENNFIYTRIGDESDASDATGSQAEILLAAVDDPLNPTVLLNSADIATAITGDDPTAPVNILSLIVHPHQPDWLFIVAAITPENDAQVNYILSFRRDTKEMTTLFNLGNSPLSGPLQIIANGQLLTFNGYSPASSTRPFDSPFIGLIPLDPDTMTSSSPININTSRVGFNQDWSQDGRWLLISERDALRLITPGEPYDEIIPHGFDNCSQAAWVNALPG